MDHLRYLCHVFVMLSRLFIAALWSSAGKGLTSWLSFVMFDYVFVIFPCGILGQEWYLIVSIPDLCHLSYFVMNGRETIYPHPATIFLLSWNYCLLFMSAAYIQVHFRLDFISWKPWEQSDQCSDCLQYRPPTVGYKQMRGADNKSRDWWAKG